MSVEGLANLRDLGGLPVAGGGATREGMLYRAEAPLGLAEGALDALGLRTVVDLREPPECEAKPTTLPSAAELVCVPVLAPRDEQGRGMMELLTSGGMEEFGHADVAPMMIRMLDEQSSAFAGAVGRLTGEGALPALVHCSAGRDRTGLVIALTLAALGVERAAILADYERSNALRDATYAAYAPALRELGVDPDRLEGLYSAPGSVIAEALEHVEREHGSVGAYLEAGGLPAGALARLRSALLT